MAGCIRRSRTTTRVPEYFLGLVQPTNAERTLKGYRLRERRQIDWREQYERAVEAFEHRGILVLVGDRQVSSLDEEIELRPDTQVSFVRLVMLVGGCEIWLQNGRRSYGQEGEGGIDLGCSRCVQRLVPRRNRRVVRSRLSRKRGNFSMRWLRRSGM